jgi:arylsulfatase A-like enzyme
MKLFGNLASYLTLCLYCTAAIAQSGSDTSRPNFLIVYGEGAGWVSTSVQMDRTDANSKSAFIETPNLERLAARGLTFSRGYAPSPRCTPSRAGLVTGKSPGLLHMTYISASGTEGRDEELAASRQLLPPAPIVELPAQETTYAELLQQAGYATAHFGKWHLGRADPMEHGFDESDGANNNNAPDGARAANPKEMFATAERGVDFMRRQVAAGRPFLLQVSHYPDRISRNNPDEMIAAARDMDTAFGQLLDALDELDVANNTYVIFTTDHGTQGNGLNGPLSNGKGSVLEGGLRVPFIVAGPRARAGEWSPVPVTALDIFPTIAELSGNADNVSAEVEGGSLAGVLRDADAKIPRSREEIVFHFPHYDLRNAGPATAMLLGDYKLVRNYEDDETLLYDLSVDPGEQSDLSAKLPDSVEDLGARLEAYLLEIDAQMPRRNPAYR